MPHKNGLTTTTAVEQYRQGYVAGRRVLTEGLDADAIDRRVTFDRIMVDTSPPTFAAFHRGRLDGLTATGPEADLYDLIIAVGAGFHPDTSGDAYTSLPDGYTPERVDAILDAATDADVDLYEAALAVVTA